MRNSRFLIVMGLSLGLSGIAYAGPCDGVTNCELPSSSAGTQSGWTIATSRVSNIKALDSVGPTGNQTGSHYFWGGVSGLGGAATLAKGSISTTGDGLQVVGLFSNAPAPGAPGTIVSGGTLPGLLGNHGYTIYAQACPSSGALDSATCSLWSKIGTVTTQPYPATVFSAIQKPGDATTNTLIVHTAVPAADVGDISQINLEVDNLITPAENQVLGAIGWLGNTAYTIDNSLYTNGYNPNAKYRVQGTVTYPAGVDVPTGGGQILEFYWTTPVNPSNVTVSNVTHCSADITSRNTGGATGNPTYTVYNLCAVGSSGSCLNGAINGTGVPTDTITRTITGLVPGTNYTATAQALVGNGDGTQAGWNSSAIINGSPNPFTTDGTNGAFTLTNTTTTSVDFNFPGGFDVSGAVSWQRRINGVLSGPVVAGLPPSTISFTGLTPNTQYTLQVTVNEASCNYTVPSVALSVTTTPTVPATFTMSATAPRQLNAAWTANGNPGTTVYQVQYCTDAAFTTGCLTQNTAAGVVSATITTGIVPETTYFAHVRALTVGGGLNSGYSNSDSDTTPNEAPSVSPVTVTLHITSATLTGHATDFNDAGTSLKFHWAITSQPGGSNPAFTVNDQMGNGSGNNTTQLTFDVPGTYQGTLTVTDHSGVGGLSTIVNWNTSGTSVPGSISVSPALLQVQTGGTSSAFTATVKDQFGVVMPGHTVNWSISPVSGGTVNTANGTSTTIAAGTTLGNFTVSATLSGVTPATSTLHVVADGPQVDSLGFVLAPGNKGGTLTVVGHDNVIHTISSNFSASDPSVTFAPNSATSADGVPGTSAVTFSKAGTFTLTADLGFGVSSSTLVTVPQILTSIRVTPDNVTISVLINQTFAAIGYDQFGNPMSLGTITWAGSGINGAGVFHTTSLGSNIQISASSNGTTGCTKGTLGCITGTAFITVINYDVTAAHPYPVPWKSTAGVPFCFTGLGSSAKIRIYTISGREVFHTEVTPAAPGPNTCDYSWAVQNNSGESLASGVYLYVIESPTTTKNGKLIIIK